METKQAKQTEAINSLLAERTRGNFYNFFRYFWSTVCPETYRANFHHKVLCEELQAIGERIIKRQSKTHDLLINIPPGETKSIIVSQLWPVWLWVNDPTIRVISASYSITLSTASALKSRDCIESARFQQLFGDEVKLRRDQDAKSHFATTKGGERLAVSVGSTFTGFHAHAIILDDILNPDGAYSEAVRKTTNDWMSRTVTSRKVDERITPTVFISQRLHEADSSAHFEQIHTNVEKIILPATLDYPVTPEYLADQYQDGLLNPTRKPKHVLEERRKTLGSRDYAGQYGQQPMPDAGNIIKKQWFRQWDKHSFDWRRQTVDFYLDSAYTANQTNDPSAILAYFKFREDIYLVGCEAVHLELPELIRFLITWTERNGYTNRSRIFVEPKASGKSVVQQLKRETGLNVIEDEAPKESKVARVHAITPTLEAGRVFLPTNEAWTDSFIYECATFPGGRHDDRVDCIAAAIRKATEESRGFTWEMQGYTWDEYARLMK